MMYELKFLEANVCMIYITLYSVGCGRGGTMDPSLSLSMGINGGVWFLAREKTWRGGGVCGSWPGKKTWRGGEGQTSDNTTVSHCYGALPLFKHPIVLYSGCAALLGL